MKYFHVLFQTNIFFASKNGPNLFSPTKKMEMLCFGLDKKLPVNLRQSVFIDFSVGPHCCKVQSLHSSEKLLLCADTTKFQARFWALPEHAGAEGLSTSMKQTAGYTGLVKLFRAYNCRHRASRRFHTTLIITLAADLLKVLAGLGECSSPKIFQKAHSHMAQRGIYKKKLMFPVRWSSCLFYLKGNKTLHSQDLISIWDAFIFQEGSKSRWHGHLPPCVWISRKANAPLSNTKRLSTFLTQLFTDGLSRKNTHTNSQPWQEYWTMASAGVNPQSAVYWIWRLG